MAPPQSCPKSPTNFRDTVHGNSPKYESSLALTMTQKVKQEAKNNVIHCIFSFGMITDKSYLKRLTFGIGFSFFNVCCPQLNPFLWICQIEIERVWLIGIGIINHLVTLVCSRRLTNLLCSAWWINCILLSLATIPKFNAFLIEDELRSTSIFQLTV